MLSILNAYMQYRNRLASGLRIAHQQLGNIQLVSQYLTILGTLALQLHDAGQAREILKSALTLAKTLYDIPAQMWILSVFTGMPLRLCGILVKAIETNSSKVRHL